MKIFLAIYFLLIFMGDNLYAHKTNEAFFRITQKESVVEIETEFPWTLRNALLKFSPELLKAKTKEAYKKAFVDYLKANLVLTDSNGNAFEFIEFTKMDNMGHSHQDNYRITYKGSSLEKIENTLMFNIFDNQVNYHRIKVDGASKIHKTTKGKTTFELLSKKNFSHWWIFTLLAILASILVLEIGKSNPLTRKAPYAETKILDAKNPGTTPGLRTNTTKM